MGYLDNFAIVANELTIEGVLEAFAALGEILGFKSEIKRSEWGATLGFPGATANPRRW